MTIGKKKPGEKRSATKSNGTSSEKKVVKKRQSSPAKRPPVKETTARVKRQQTKKSKSSVATQKGVKVPSNKKSETDNVSKTEKKSIKKRPLSGISKQVPQKKVRMSNRGDETKKRETSIITIPQKPSTNGQKEVPIVAIKNYIMKFFT